MFSTERLQLADDLSAPAPGQLRSGAGLQRNEGQLVQMRPLDICEAGMCELSQWLAPPQLECLGERGRRHLHVALPQEPPARGDKLFEANSVHFVGFNGERIARLAGEDRSRPEGPPQLTDLCLEGVGGIGRLPFLPQGIDEAVGSNRLPTMQGEQCQQGSLLGAADLHRHTCLQDLEFTEEADLHASTVGRTNRQQEKRYRMTRSFLISVARQSLLRPPAQASLQNQEHRRKELQ